MDVQAIWPTVSNAFSSVELITKAEVRGSPPRKAARLGDSATRFSEGLGRISAKKLVLNYAGEYDSTS